MIRKAVGADLPALLDIENRAFAESRLSRRSLRAMIPNPKALMCVMEKNARVCGYGLLLYRRNSKTARLYSFALHPDFQGRGVAKDLLCAMEDMCEKPNISLEVRRDNTVAIAFYRRMGFVMWDGRENYYEDGEAALIMRKNLTP